MPCMLYHTVHIKMEDHICVVFARDDVPCAHVREIKGEPHLFDIWHKLPHAMMTLMHHVVFSLTLIQSLRPHTQTWSSPQSDEVLSDSHHDYLSSHASGERSTSP